jgi:hypothetical protein
MRVKTQPSPVIQRVAALAMQLGFRHLAGYGATRRRHYFTQHQLMACLILRAYTKTTYRGILEFLSVSPKVRQKLGLQDKLPHYTTLQKFSARSQLLAIADAMIQTGVARPPATLTPHLARQRWMPPAWKPPRPARIFNAVGAANGIAGSRLRP